MCCSIRKKVKVASWCSGFESWGRRKSRGYSSLHRFSLELGMNRRRRGALLHAKHLGVNTAFGRPRSGTPRRGFSWPRAIFAAALIEMNKLLVTDKKVPDVHVSISSWSDVETDWQEWDNEWKGMRPGSGQCMERWWSMEGDL